MQNSQKPYFLPGVFCLNVEIFWMMPAGLWPGHPTTSCCCEQKHAQRSRGHQCCGGRQVFAVAFIWVSFRQSPNTNVLLFPEKIASQHCNAIIDSSSSVTLMKSVFHLVVCFCERCRYQMLPRNLCLEQFLLYGLSQTSTHGHNTKLHVYRVIWVFVQTEDSHGSRFHAFFHRLTHVIVGPILHVQNLWTQTTRVG